MKNIKKYLIVVGIAVICTLGFSIAFANADVYNQTIPNQCYTFNNNLIRGISHQDVYALQTLLQRENVFFAQPTGYFGPVTQAGVIAFQEKYASEILYPSGLVRGTGFVGVATRAKLNVLYRCGILPLPGTNQSPIINGVSGPTMLNVNQISTWTINATDPENGLLSYAVTWGDEPIYYPMPMNSSNSLQFSQTATFTHTYYTAGIYSPTFSVRDNAGNTATSSISVNVGTTNSTNPVINYLQPNAGMIGATVIITGSGFTQTGNRIKFGNLGTENNPAYSVNSYNGTTLTFTVPSSNYFACWYTSPRCLAPMYMVQPNGTYAVSVINANGQQSNEVMFTVTTYGY